MNGIQDIVGSALALLDWSQWTLNDCILQHQPYSLPI